MRFPTKTQILTLATLLLWASIADAQGCAAIKADKKRLECYDAAAKGAAVKTLQQNQARAEEVLRSLRKIAGATELGISMRDYGQLVLEQASLVDEALRKIPDGDFKEAAVQARQSYVDARSLWSSMFDSTYVQIFLKYNKETLAKYPIDPGYLSTLGSSGDFAKTSDMSKSMILSPVWKVAREHLERAEKAASSNGL